MSNETQNCEKLIVIWQQSDKYFNHYKWGMNYYYETTTEEQMIEKHKLQ